MAFSRKSSRIFFGVLLVCGFSLTVFEWVRATTPNPGHPWTAVGDGVFAVTGPTILRTFTLPNADATVLTSLTTDFDVASAGALTIGNSVATSVSICNALACDTLSLATNADADTVSIGDSLDTLNLAGTTIATTLTTTSSATFASSTSNSDVLAIKPQSTTATATFTGTITSADLTAARTWTLPDTTGTLALLSDISGSAGGWTDGGTDVNLSTSTDNVGLGGASLGKLSVDGDTDEIQLLIQGNVTQTSNLVVFENSAGTDQLIITNTGNVTATGDLAINGGDVTSSGALTVTPGSGTNLNVSLTTTGDFAVNTNHLYVDTSAGFVGVGTSSPAHRFTVDDNGAAPTNGYVAGIHADDFNPFAVGVFNDTFSSTVPGLEMVINNSGDTLIGNPGAHNFQIYTSGFSSPRLTISGTGAVSTSGTLTSAGVLTAQTASSGLVLGTGSAATTLSSTATSARAISFPNAAGTLALTSDITSGNTIKTVTTRPDMATGGTADITENSLTTYRVGLFRVNGNLTVNQLSYNVSTVTTAGSYRICVYSEDGATKLIDVTDVPAVGVNSVTVSSVALTPGNYYIAFGCATTCNNQITHYVSTSTPMFSTSTPTGKRMYEADTTMTSGTCNTTLPTLTGTFNRVPVIRLDN